MALSMFPTLPVVVFVVLSCLNVYQVTTGQHISLTVTCACADSIFHLNEPVRLKCRVGAAGDQGALHLSLFHDSEILESQPLPAASGRSFFFEHAIQKLECAHEGNYTCKLHNGNDIRVSSEMDIIEMEDCNIIPTTPLVITTTEPPLTSSALIISTSGASPTTTPGFETTAAGPSRTTVFDATSPELSSMTNPLPLTVRATESSPTSITSSVSKTDVTEPFLTNPATFDTSTTESSHTALPVFDSRMTYPAITTSDINAGKTKTLPTQSVINFLRSSTIKPASDDSRTNAIVKGATTPWFDRLEWWHVIILGALSMLLIFIMVCTLNEKRYKARKEPLPVISDQLQGEFEKHFPTKAVRSVDDYHDNTNALALDSFPVITITSEDDDHDDTNVSSGNNFLKSPSQDWGFDTKSISTSIAWSPLKNETIEEGNEKSLWDK